MVKIKNSGIQIATLWLYRLTHNVTINILGLKTQLEKSKQHVEQYKKIADGVQQNVNDQVKVGDMFYVNDKIELLHHLHMGQQRLRSAVQ